MNDDLGGTPSFHPSSFPISLWIDAVGLVVTCLALGFPPGWRLHHFFLSEKNWKRKKGGEPPEPKVVADGNRVQPSLSISSHLTVKNTACRFGNYSRIETACQNRASVMAGRSEKEKYEIICPFIRGQTYPPLDCKAAGLLFSTLYV